MKNCDNCGKRVYRQKAEGEYGMPAIDGAKYPDECPRCGEELNGKS